MKSKQEMKQEIKAMDQELERLIRIQDKVVGMHLKRINFKIAELQNRIDHAKLQSDEYISHDG